MSEKSLQIFELCKKLAELLGDKEAIADLKLLLNRHPEMFKDMQEVSQTIKEVVSEPDVITNAKREGAILAIKTMGEKKKIGEVAIENDNRTNIIFHANKRNISNRDRRILVEASSAIKTAPTRLDRYADKSSDLSRDSKVLSTSAEKSIPQKHSEKSQKSKSKSNDNEILM